MPRKIWANSDGTTLEVDCLMYRNDEWVTMCLADFENVPEGFYLYDYETETKPLTHEEMTARELEWAAGEIPVITRQLEAIEEDEAGVPPDDLLPGTRAQWLAYRGKVRNWKEGAVGFPDLTKRPVRPA